jgi:hypothetical protein
VIHLRGAGVTTTPINILEEETPWTTSGASFQAVGYGIGSNAGGRRDCPIAEEDEPDLVPSGTKRRASFSFSGTGVLKSGVWQAALASSSVRTLCSGDSGGPWVVTRQGIDLVTAVTSRSAREPGETVRGSLVLPKMGWIQDVSEGFVPALNCVHVRDHRYTPTLYYQRCTE